MEPLLNSSRGDRTIDDRSEVIEWLGPRGWSGRAASGYENFSFIDLPWRDLKREGERIERILCVKASRSRRVFRLEDVRRAGGGPAETVYAKRYSINSLRRQIGNRLARGKAEREFDLGLRLRKAGLPTPVPLAWAWRLSAYRPRGAGAGSSLPAASYLLTREWPNGGSLRQWLGKNPAAAATLLPVLAAFLAHAHQRGFYHDDCSSDNLLVAPDPDFGRADPGSFAGDPFAFIDIDNGKLYTEPVPVRRRARNLFQVLRSLDFDVLSSDARREFVELYLEAAGLKQGASPEQWMATIDRLAMRKDGASALEPS